MRLGRLLLTLCCVLAVVGCARRPGYVAASLPPDPAPVSAIPVVEPIGEAPYTLDSGDKLRIVVFGQEGLTSSYSVDAAGFITMTLIGAVPARGVTTAELARTIAAKLKQGYIREPHVAVEVETYRPFFILGEVTTPGQYAYVPNMTVETAVAIAGGFTPRAQRKTVVLNRPVDPASYSRGPVALQTPIRPGDTVIVKERVGYVNGNGEFFFFVRVGSRGPFLGVFGFWGRGW